MPVEDSSGAKAVRRACAHRLTEGLADALAALSSLLARVQQRGAQLGHGLGPELLRLYAIVLHPRYMQHALMMAQGAHSAAGLLLGFARGLAACAGYANDLQQERELIDALAFPVAAVDAALSALAAAGAGERSRGVRRRPQARTCR